ncbi:MAG: DNA-processing protein DprA [Oscillospiraceae bacterium]
MDKRAYWVWLQHAFGAGSQKPNYLDKRFGSIAEFYEGGVKLWSEFTFISEREISSLQNFTPKGAEAQIEYAEKMGQLVLTPEEELYPDLLRNIEDPPAVLWVKGEIPDFDNILSISVVGSRKATPGALKTANLLSYELSKKGAIIVSGGALGIDAAAHRGAMMGGSPTVCVLACGIDVPYLMENQRLRNRIVEKGGALITENPVNTDVNKGVFAIRNRLMSGLSHGLLVVEAAKKSGTMLTVKCATRQNRDLFAVPGDIHNPLAEGTNALIRDGATPVSCVEDILNEYDERFVSQRREPVSMLIDEEDEKPAASIILDVSKIAQEVYGVLQHTPMHISQISIETGLRPSQILTAATELELMGYIESYSGQRFSRK